MADREQGAAQTPLLDLLRGVPADARMTYEINPTHHHMIPVGRLCGEAADKIVDLADELARVTKERDEARASADELRRAIADLIGADPETWPDHGNAPLAIAASFALEQNRAEQAEAREAALQAALDAVMFEYCPESMTKEQVDRWCKHQLPAPPLSEGAKNE